MKKTIRPSVALVVWLALLFAVGFIGTVGDDSSVKYLLIGISVALFVVAFIRYFTGKRIDFDEESFTVDGKTYKFTEITRAEVSSVLITRNTSTLCFKIYVGEEMVAKFTKAQKNAEEFISCMNKFDIKLNVE